jgi:hypothetical protein
MVNEFVENALNKLDRGPLLQIAKQHYELVVSLSAPGHRLSRDRFDAAVAEAVDGIERAGVPLDQDMIDHRDCARFRQPVGEA